VSNEARARIEACTDVAMLDLWISTEEVSLQLRSAHKRMAPRNKPLLPANAEAFQATSELIERVRIKQDADPDLPKSAFWRQRSRRTWHSGGQATYLNVIT